MSTSAIKTSMPGVGASSPASGHSILPMNVVAQKVMSSSDSGAMKPLSGSGLSYVTLQPAGQPLSLVQDHRPPVYQASYNSTGNTTVTTEKEPENDKPVVPNGVEIKTEHEATKQNQETNRNNNLSPETSSIESQDEIKSEPEAPAPSTEPIVVSTPVPVKVEEKKSPLNNGSKEPEAAPIQTPITPATVTKTSPQKPEESPAKVDSVQKSKPITPTKAASESSCSNSSISSTPTSITKSEHKVATTPRAPKRKSREVKELKGAVSEGGNKPKRNRVQTQPYQSPLPEIALIVKTLNKVAPMNKNADDKLIVFYKNEFLAVRNAEGSFYVCQAMQNIYKSSRRIRIRWLSQDKNNGEIYSPDFYDYTDFDCILTNLNLNKVDKNKYQLTKFELLRTENILKRAIDVEAGVSEKPSVTEEHPDGLDLSLYKDESQLTRRKGSSKPKLRQRKRSKRESSSSPEESSSDDDDDDDDDEEDEDDEDEDEDDDNVGDAGEDKKSPRSSRTKKRTTTTNKALAIAKSVAANKVPNRAKRALIRGNKSSSVSDDVASSSTDNTTKRNAESKKTETKKSNKQQAATSSIAARTKLRGSAQSSGTSSSNTTGGRAKRVASTSGTTVTEESSRKKSRSKA